MISRSAKNIETGKVGRTADFEKFGDGVRVTGTEERAEDIIQYLGVTDISRVVIWVDILSLRVQGTPDRQDVRCMACGVIVGIGRADFWGIDSGLNVAMLNLDGIDNGKYCAGTVLKEIGLRAEPFRVGESVGTGVSETVWVAGVDREGV